MLEWLKTILGDGYTEDIDKQVSAEIGKAFVSRNDFNSKNDELKRANDTIKDLQDTAKKFDGVDIEKLRGDLTTLQSKYDTDIAAMRRDNALDVALTGAKARDLKAVRALLDMDTIKLDGNKLVGFDDQIKALQKDKAFLFEGDSAGNTRVDTGASHNEPPATDSFLNAVRAGAGLNNGKE